MFYLLNNRRISKLWIDNRRLKFEGRYFEHFVGRSVVFCQLAIGEEAAHEPFRRREACPRSISVIFSRRQNRMLTDDSWTINCIDVTRQVVDLPVATLKPH